MKKVFLALILGFIAAFGDNVTLVFGGLASNPQGGSVEVKLGEYAFDVYKNRRELVREVYSICTKPTAKIQEYITNRLRANTSPSVYVWYYHPDDDGKSTTILKCSFDSKGLYAINDVSTPNRGAKSNEMVQKIISNASFSHNFMRLIDCANAELAAKNATSTKPSRMLGLKFGARAVDASNGQEFISDLGDLSFDIFKDRRELVREVYASCLNPNEKMQNFIAYERGKGNNSPEISVYYFNPNLEQPRFVASESLICYFNDKGVVSLGGAPTPNQKTT